MSALGDFVSRRAEILSRIGDAAARGGRGPGDVEVVAVTKTVPTDRIRAAYDAGFRHFGENRVQEREAKAVALRDLGGAGFGYGATWHLVGPLQSNKASRAAHSFDVIETVDSLALARRLDVIEYGELRSGVPFRCYLQVNVDGDPAKSGFRAADLERDLAEVLSFPGLAVEGLMTVGRLVDKPEAARPTFSALRQLSERLRAAFSDLGPGLSMGMSEDYPVAVEEGATLVRIGRAIFGERH